MYAKPIRITAVKKRNPDFCAAVTTPSAEPGAVVFFLIRVESRVSALGNLIADLEMPHFASQ